MRKPAFLFFARVENKRKEVKAFSQSYWAKRGKTDRPNQGKRVANLRPKGKGRGKWKR